MSRKQLKSFFLVLMITLIMGCATRESYISFDTYNKDSNDITSDNPAFLKYYDEVRRNIYHFAYKNYNLFEQGKVTLRFTVFNNGKVGNIEEVQDGTEASEKLIKTAIIAVRKASPFIAFPEGLKEYQRLSFKVELLYDFEWLRGLGYLESPKCPIDGVEMKEIKIEYGMPSLKALEEAHQGRIILGGGFYADYMPRIAYVCPICKKMWYKRIH